MKDSLKSGLAHEHRYVVPVSKTVPALYPESPEFQAMPEVFATGFMVGLIEWACIRLLASHLEAGEDTVGTHVDVSHEAPTPPGLEVMVNVKLVSVEGRKLAFEVQAHDGIDRIAHGRHERFVVSRHRFDARLAEKLRISGANPT